MEWNGIEWNGFSRERNGMECDLKILFGCYKIKEWNGMESKSIPISSGYLCINV